MTYEVEPPVNQDSIPTIERVILTTLINPDGSLGRQGGLEIDLAIPNEPRVIRYFEQDHPE